MAKTKISEFSATPANNTDIDSINIAEGCAPSGINDAIRELMSQLKDWQAGTSNDPMVIGSSGSLTLSYGTANGVPYLNGSKVLTSGSALTFDGAILGVNGVTVGRGAGAVATNTAVGASALAVNTSGASNTAFGDSALAANTTGSNNQAFGRGALSLNVDGGQNVAVGRLALGANTSGPSNSAVGHTALSSNTTGSFNVAVGQSALGANTTASNNTAVGYQAGYTNATGAYNLFLGYQAGYTSNVSGTASNTCIGATAGYSLTTGAYNTFIGNAGTTAGSGFYVSSGSKNTILGNYNGNQGGLDIRTASNYIVLSDGDGNPRGIFDASGNLLVGTTTAGDGKVRISASANSFNLLKIDDTGSTAGNYVQFLNSAGAQAGTINHSGATSVSYNSGSDYRLKTITGPVTNSTDFINALKPKVGTWKEDGSKFVGFLAHEFAEVCPQAVQGEKDAVDIDGNPLYQSMEASSPEVIANIVSLLQEQQALILTLQADVAALKAAA